MNKPRSSNFCDGEASQKRATWGRLGGLPCPRRGLTWKYKVANCQGFDIRPRETSSRSLYHRLLYTKSLASKVLGFASALTCSTTWCYSWCVPFRDMYGERELSDLQSVTCERLIQHPSRHGRPHPAEQIQSHVDEMCRGECQCPNGVHACVIPYKRGTSAVRR